MKRRTTIPKTTLGVNITALCDIMLALLIFFMLVSRKGIDTGADPEIPLPQALAVEGLRIEDLGHSITLNVYPGPGEEPEVTTYNPTTGRQVPLRIAEPSAAGVSEPLADFLSLVRRSNPEVKVVIYAGEEMEYRHMEKVLIACANAQIRSISFAARRE